MKKSVFFRESVNLRWGVWIYFLVLTIELFVSVGSTAELDPVEQAIRNAKDQKLKDCINRVKSVRDYIAVCDLGLTDDTCRVNIESLCVNGKSYRASELGVNRFNLGHAPTLNLGEYGIHTYRFGFNFMELQGLNTKDKRYFKEVEFDGDIQGKWRYCNESDPSRGSGGNESFVRGTIRDGEEVDLYSTPTQVVEDYGNRPPSEVPNLAVSYHIQGTYPNLTYTLYVVTTMGSISFPISTKGKFLGSQMRINGKSVGNTWNQALDGFAARGLRCMKYDKFKNKDFFEEDNELKKL